MYRIDPYYFCVYTLPLQTPIQDLFVLLIDKIKYIKKTFCYIEQSIGTHSKKVVIQNVEEAFECQTYIIESELRA